MGSQLIISLLCKYYSGFDFLKEHLKIRALLGGFFLRCSSSGVGKATAGSGRVWNWVEKGREEASLGRGRNRGWEGCRGGASGSGDIRQLLSPLAAVSPSPVPFSAKELVQVQGNPLWSERLKEG